MNALAYCMFALTFLGFALVASGYTILIRQAFQSPDRARALRRIFSGHSAGFDPKGLRLIGAGAFIGLLVFVFIILITFF